MAGYSEKLLLEKLGYVKGKLLLVQPPAYFMGLLGDLPKGLYVRKSGTGPFHAEHLFVTKKADMLRRLPALKRMLRKDGMLWVSWPKKTSGVATDVTEDVVRDAALSVGLVDVKVCAVDEVWSGLKLVYRIVDR